MARLEPAPADVLRAARLAAYAHRGQKRKTSDVPYVVHPLRVAERILGGRVPLEVDLRVAVLAAILHDVLEDTDVPRERLVEEFGEDVVRVVDEVTQDQSLPREERRRKMVEGCGRYSLEGRVVKLADRWDNMSELGAMEPDFVARYCAEARTMLRNMEGTWPEAEAAIAAIVESSVG